MNRYKKSKIILGEGSYKKVTKAIDEEEGIEVAYNEVRIKNYDVDTQNGSAFSKEISLLKSVSHPNILKIMDYWFTDDEFVFITEFMTGGSVMVYIANNGPLNTKLIKKWGNQIILGLMYLHNLNIIHRDIKNDNIFINGLTGEVKIGDLGLAKERHNKRYTMVGTPGFMAKEIFEGGGYTEKIDIYAFGMCLIEMATGKTPYSECRDNSEIYKNVLEGGKPQSFYMVEDPCLRNLIQGCIADPDHRSTSQEVLDHHFFRSEEVSCNCAAEENNRDQIITAPVEKDEKLSLIKEIELHITAVDGPVVTFQMVMLRSRRYIKFSYDQLTDTIEKVTKELATESIIGPEYMEGFAELLRVGLEKAKEQEAKSANFVKGSDEISESDLDKLCALKMKKTASEDCSDVLNAKIPNGKMENRPSLENSFISDSDSFYKGSFGAKTIEEMQRIGEEMKLQQVKQDLKTNSRIVEQLNNLDLTNSVNFTKDDVVVADLDNRESGLYSTSEEQGKIKISLISNNETAVIIDKNEIINNSNQDSSVTVNAPIQISDINATRMTSDVIHSSRYTIIEPDRQITSDLPISPKPSADNCSLQDGKEINAYSSQISHKDNFDFEINRFSQIPNERTYHPSIGSPEIQYYSLSNSSEKSIGNGCSDKSQPIGSPDLHYHVVSTSPDKQHQFPVNSQPDLHANNIPTILPDKTINSVPNSPLERPVSLQFQSHDKSSTSSPETSKTEDQIEDDLKSHFTEKYSQNHSISQFAMDVATVNGRSEDIYKGWIKILKDEDISSVFDLKLLAYEDWEKIPLTVFSCRAMQNMLYPDGIPLREKQLIANPKIGDYDNRMSIRDFLDNICEQINRKEVASNWENKLLAQDIQTVGELRSLHPDDWNRLGLSVYCYRIVKNIIYKKGKIQLL